MDIKIMQGNNYFDLRVAAIVVSKGRVLTQKREDGDYYYLPGGKVQIGERFESALKREFIEEIGLDDLVIKDIASLIQNFYANFDIKSHSINVLFHCDLVEDSILLTLNEMKGVESHKRLVYTWLDINSKEFAMLRPVSAQEIIKNNKDFCYLLNDVNNMSN